MTSERFQSYKTAAAAIEARERAGKLHGDEALELRDCAQGLLLCAEPSSDEASELRITASARIDKLVESDRWLEATANDLREAISACCPEPALV